MSRRKLVLLFLAAPSLTRSTYAPTDELKLNSFAGAYNAYVDRLKTGEIAIKLWEKVLAIWRRF